MPSPVGHALAGAAAGWLVAAASPPRTAPPSGAIRLLARPVSSRLARPRLLEEALWFAMLGALPDVDFAFGTHSTYTHSLGATVLIAALVCLAAPADRLRWAGASAAAYSSHILLDWLGDDTTPAIGIMALWPLTNEFYQSDLHWFMAISRRYHLSTFWTHNITAVIWEIILLLPVLCAIGWLRWRTDPAPR